jgi:uncharacterized SAM-binding protein YcdF (DUF218 family)
VPIGVVVCDAWYLAEELVRVLARGRKDWISVLKTNRLSDADLYVAKLYAEGSAPRILCVSSHVSCAVYPADYAARHLEALGVPEGALSTLHLPLVDCGEENLRRVVEHVQAQGWKSALLVVGPIGSRPGRRLTQRYFDQAGIRVAMTYSPRDRANFVDGWWRTHAKAQRMIAAAMHAALDLLHPQCG